MYPTPKYYCFHPGTLCKCNANEQTDFTVSSNQGIRQEGHIQLSYQMCPLFRLNYRMCPKTLPVKFKLHFISVGSDRFLIVTAPNIVEYIST